MAGYLAGDDPARTTESSGLFVELTCLIEGIRFHETRNDADNEFSPPSKTYEPCRVCAACDSFPGPIGETPYDAVKFVLGGCAIPIKPAACILQISRSKFYRLIQSGELETVKYGRRSFVTVKSIMGLLSRGSDPTAALCHRLGMLRA
jgi:excisionase family DNA binding protein